MKRAKLLKSIPCDTPDSTKNDVILKSQIIIDGTKQTLNIDMFYKGQLRARYFADPEERRHCAFVDGAWTTNTIANVARMCWKQAPEHYPWFCYCGDYKWDSERDKEAALNLFDTYSISAWEEDIRHDKRMSAAQRKKERIARMMDAVPAVPDRAEQWLKEEIFPEEYLFVREKGGRNYYGCTKCGASSWTKKKFKQYQRVECPKCQSQVKVEKKKEARFQYANVILLQIVDNDTWVERQFRAESWWHHNGTRRIDLHENIRVLIPKGQSWGKAYYGEVPNADEFEQEWWDKNSRNRQFQQSYLYPHNLSEVLPFGSLEHTGMEILAGRKIKFNVNRVLINWSASPKMEYLIKSGLTRLSAELINHHWDYPGNFKSSAGKLNEFLQIDGNRVSRLKHLNGNLCSLEWLQYEQETGKKITDDSLRSLAKWRLDPHNCEPILKELGSVNRMVNYLKKQKISAGKVIQTWRDYLRMAAEEGMDTSDDIVRLPKDLKARHDALVEISNTRRDKKLLESDKYRKLDAGILLHLPEVKRYFWEDDTYMIIPAGKCEELMKEGRELHHCVGASTNYMESMASGKTWILFLRKKTELEKAYYTIEINMKNDNIIQYYSEFDRQPDKEKIRKVLDTFKTQVKRRRQRIAISA